jgi:hypothetical protein
LVELEEEDEDGDESENESEDDASGPSGFTCEVVLGSVLDVGICC